MPSKDELASQRRAQILHAAATVFARSGVDGARMDDIVSESGLSKGTLYWYFDSKQEIIVALVDQVIRAEYEQLQSLLENPGSARERLMAFVDAHAAILSAEPVLGKLGVEIYSMSGRMPQVREFVQRYYDDFIDALAQLLQQGQDRGELNLEYPAEAAVNIACLIEGLTLLWSIDVDRIDLARQFRGAVNMLIGASSRSG